jgi:hypothetical protein
MFEDAAPGLREAQQPLVAGSPEDGSGKEHGGPDGAGYTPWLPPAGCPRG